MVVSMVTGRFRPIPARRTWILALLAALGTGGTMPAQVVLSEILFDPIGINTGRQAVEIRNLGGGPVDLTGYWLSFKPSAWQFPDRFGLAPGGTVVVHIMRSGTNGTGDLYTGLAGMRNLDREDAVALFSRQLFTDPASLVDFVEWGMPGQDGESVATAKGIWQTLTAIDVSSLREGSSIALVAAGTGAAGWCVDGSPSLGAPNDGCTVSQAKSPVRLNEVVPGPDGIVELWNAGDAMEDLEGKWLAGNHGWQYAFAAGIILRPGEFLVVRSGPGTDGDHEVFAPGMSLAPAEAVVLFAGRPGNDSTSLIDFVQWGSPGGAWVSLAVQAGLWPAGAAVDTASLVPGGAIAAGVSGTGPSRWTIDNTPTPGQDNASPPSSPLVLNEVLPETSGPPAAAVEIWNRGDADVAAGGLRLCVSSPDHPEAACAVLPAVTIPVGSFEVIRLGPEALAGEVAVTDLPPLSVKGGEVALLVTASTSNPNDYLAYVRWGTGAAGLEAPAVRAGVWPGGSIDSTGLAPGSSLARAGDGVGPESFRIDVTPSLGRSNTEGPLSHDFVRRDCNMDGTVDISDPIALLQMLFLGGERPACERSCDSNDDGGVDISDPIHMLASLFLGGERKPPRTCGPDTTPDTLSCVDYKYCP